MYDLIADLHGFSAGLNPLLNELEERKIDGVRQHLNRKSFFLGDFVKRGPEQVMTVNNASETVEKGDAVTLTGKNELDALSCSVQDLQDRVECLRLHKDKKRKQHIHVFEQVGESSDEHRTMIKWLKTSHLHLDLPNSREVHASLHPDLNLAERTHINSKNGLLADVWVTARRKDSDVYNAVETLLKGFEIRLPKPLFLFDTDRDSPHQIHKSLWQQI